MAPTRLHLAVLDCDTPVPNVLPERGLYSDVFESLLRDAVLKTPGLTKLKLDFSSYDSVQGELPSSQDLHHIDGIIITGSGTWRFSDVLSLLYCQQNVPLLRQGQLRQRMMLNHGSSRLRTSSRVKTRLTTQFK